MDPLTDADKFGKCVLAVAGAKNDLYPTLLTSSIPLAITVIYGHEPLLRSRDSCRGLWLYALSSKTALHVFNMCRRAMHHASSQVILRHGSVAQQPDRPLHHLVVGCSVFTLQIRCRDVTAFRYRSLTIKQTIEP